MLAGPKIVSTSTTGGVHESPIVSGSVMHSSGTVLVRRAASVALWPAETRVVTTTEPALTLTLTDEAGTPRAAETLAMYASVGKASTVVWNVAFHEMV